MKADGIQFVECLRLSFLVTLGGSLSAANYKTSESNVLLTDFSAFSIVTS